MFRNFYAEQNMADPRDSWYKPNLLYNIHYMTCEASEGVCVVYPDTVTLPASEYIHSVLYNVVNNTNNINNTDSTDDEPLYRKGLFNYGFWVTSIISAAFSIVFGLIAMGFAIFNICGKPIETITGPMGLYLWNGTAFLFALLDMVMFLTLFLTSLQKNFLLQEDVDKFVLTEKTNLGYSFYLVPAAVVMYLVNIILLVCSGYKLKCSFGSEAEKVVDNGMILY
ncbi:clarin-1-like isoform X2 [Mercenaria mercenaria]|uniref:clarin-1-like isoform X2 n=1 Tax=Mercenaria mercenaria TaxID=6596 RepID=UPI00234F685A|nr:clarin-1-like isoform X2 [Mercenaria mercenaria]